LSSSRLVSTALLLDEWQPFCFSLSQDIYLTYTRINSLSNVVHEVAHVEFTVL